MLIKKPQFLIDLTNTIIHFVLFNAIITYSSDYIFHSYLQALS